jgi:1-aminocyclopropane-1-carboxylate deaminase/D-cysteine desulfhydrase-like pyridoxal-dependent ACC family enzyme
MPAPLAIGTYPTPVQRLDALSSGATSVWVKRDDLTDARYGGNKVRKLEYLLARAQAKRAQRVVTVGAVGSHHVLATAVHATRLGLGVEAVVVPQPRTEHVLEDLRADLALGVTLYPARWWAMVPILVAWRVLAGSHYVPVGGSSADGAMGYVDAARELATQVRAGEMPEPDVIMVTLGSGGTAAGIVAGLAAERMKTRVVAVCVTDPRWLVRFMARRLARACLRRVGAPAGLERLEIDERWLGDGYGHATPAGEAAMAKGASLGLVLDPTYTAKTFAAVVDRAGRGDGETILYWHTLSSAPIDPLLRGAPKAEDLDRRLVRLMT